MSTQSQPKQLDKLMGMAGQGVGLVQMVMSWAKDAVQASTNAAAAAKNLAAITGDTVKGGAASGLKGSIGHLLANPAFRTVLGAAGFALSTYSAFKSVNALMKDFTKMGLLNVGMSAFGVATSFNVLASALHLFGVSSTFGPAGWIVAAGVIGISMLWSWLSGLFSSPPSEQVAAQKLNEKVVPAIWTTGPLVLVGAGTIGLLMGWSPKHQPPIMSEIVAPRSIVEKVVRQTNGIAQLPKGTEDAPTILVERATPGSDAHVTIVSSAGNDRQGRERLRLQTYTVSKNLEFVSAATPQKGYIPFYIYRNGKAEPNPEVIRSMNSQEALLRSVLSGALTTIEAQRAVQLASASNKYDVDAESYY
jgi:hypothetical protein